MPKWKVTVNKENAEMAIYSTGNFSYGPNMRLWALGLLALSVAVTKPAAAWWDFAKWGITEQQAIAASKGRAQPCESRCLKFLASESPRLFVPEVRAGGMTGTGTISFDADGKLNTVVLKFREEGPVSVSRSLRDVLTGIYGEPVSVRDGGFFTVMWRDPAKGTLIELFYVPQGGVVAYRPIASGL